MALLAGCAVAGKYNFPSGQPVSRLKRALQRNETRGFSGTFLMTFNDGTARGSVDAKRPRTRRWILTATDVRRRDCALPSGLTEERFETRDRRAKPRLPRVNRLAR
jgi:hypothetical protein